MADVRQQLAKLALQGAQELNDDCQEASKKGDAGRAVACAGGSAALLKLSELLTQDVKDNPFASLWR